jgi:hypothetical protein
LTCVKLIPAHGRAFVFLTAIGGGLAVRVIQSFTLLQENWDLT